MILPNLIGCGAGKSGTTSLYHYLDQHPNVFMTPAKETHFFSKQYPRGLSWYSNQFTGAGDESVIGEFSTSYMIDPKVPERMAKAVPGARLLFIFRNPIDRAYSNYWFSLTTTGTQDQRFSFSEAIRKESGRNRFIRGGCYFDHLKQFLRFYSQDQIHIILTEEFQANPAREMSLCFRFLNIDHSFTPNVTRKYNQTVAASSKLTVALFRRWTQMKRKMRPLLLGLPASIRRDLSFLERRAGRKIFGQTRLPMPPSDQRYLAEIYREPNEQLANFLGRELTVWE